MLLRMPFEKLIEELQPDLSNPFDPDGGWTAGQRAAARERAYETLVRARDEGFGGPSPRTNKAASSRCSMQTSR